MLSLRSRSAWLPLSASFALGIGVLACAGPQNRAARAAPSPREEIRRVAALVEKKHVVAVDSGALLRVAAQGLDTEAGAGPVAAAEDPAAALDVALARLRAARPDAGDGLLVAIAVKAMAESLKDSSRYLSPEALRRTARTPSTPPELMGGIGLVLKRAEPTPFVLRVLPGSPAAVAGVKAGEELREIDGRPTTGLTVDDAAQALRGRVGSRTTLALGKPGEASRILQVPRAEIDSGLVDCRVIDGRVLYLGVRGLDTRTPGRVRDFAAAPGAPAQLVILDLRGNVGGLLQSARELADTFLASGRILSIEGRSVPRDVQEATPGTSPLEQARLAVLVDAETGSGAEAVAAAVQDNLRGTIIGSHTAAKASIDTVYELAGGGMLRLATARLHRANGEPIDGRGVTPDVSTDTAPPAREPPSFVDAACPGFASPASVASDPVVVRATSVLLGR